MMKKLMRNYTTIGRAVLLPVTLDAVSIALSDKENSPLLRYELADVLGQIKNPEACAALECVLADTSDNAMVRHESATKVGALESLLYTLRTFIGNNKASKVVYSYYIHSRESTPICSY